MNSERERQITSIFHSAIEREGAERRAFLDGACASDPELRREIELLIESHEEAGSFIDAPAYERDAGLIENEGDGSLAGRSLGQYRLISLVGTGGMGEVYLAEDTRLARRVAIKVLATHVTADQKQVGRFQQEARAASALNHPNIITVYDINEANGTYYIATEYIDGQTLAVRLSRGGVSINEALDIAIQVAGALGAAHGAGVVHRDIKPENVMLRPDGYVKVLDFGIAKLIERQKPSLDGEAPTRALVQTGKGVVMGTAHYMSPEQARGQAVDARTDIWSLGVVLYEMVTGRVPFEGETVSDCIASILKMDPPQLTEIAPHVPTRLDWVVQKALRKDADERYHTAKEMLSDLRAVKQDVDAQAQLERSVRPGSTSRAGATTGGDVQPASDITAGESAAATATATRTTSSAEYIVTGITRHKRGALLALAAVTVIIAGLGFGLYKYAGRRNAAPPIFQNVQVSRVTTSGRASEANISPDGRYVVYVEDDDAGNSGILVKQTATGNTLQIVPPAKIALWGTVFSPDSDFVYYLANDLSSGVTTLYRVPSIGGETKRVLVDIDSPPAISPDGKRFAFVREERAVKFDIVVANVDGTGERVVTTRTGTDWFEEDGPAWSPDGRTIACAAGTATRDKLGLMLLGVDAETGATRELSPKRWAGAMGRVVWMPGGAALALIAMEHAANDRNQVWRVTHSTGEASRVTNDVQGRNARSLGVTADGSSLVTVTQQTVTRIETVPASGDVGRATRITPGAANYDGLEGLAWAPEGRIVFSSYDGGQSDIWIMNADGTGRRRLTSDDWWDGEPAVSPDGRHVVFASNRAGGGTLPFLWRMDLDGGNLKQLTGAEDNVPDISPDGRWVIYNSWAPGPQGVTGQGMWKVSIDGGSPVQLTDYTVGVPSYSPDGQWIALINYDDKVTPKRWRNAVISASGGPIVKQFDRPNYTYQYVRWTPDGRHLSYIGQPAVPSNIWLQPVAGGEPRKLTDFKTDMMFRHAWSRDGKTLAVVRGSETTDVVLMKESAQP